MARKSYSEQEREQVKEALMATVLQCIVDRGLIHSSIETLCQKVGISKTFFYSLFASKEELEGRFDVVLGALSPDYEDVRRLGLLNPPRVFLVKKGWIGRFLTKDDRGTAHTKPHLFLSQIQTAELIGGCEADSENV